MPPLPGFHQGDEHIKPIAPGSVAFRPHQALDFLEDSAAITPVDVVADLLAHVEAIALCEELTGRPMHWSNVDANRIGDHIWWISDIRRFQSHYPEWKITHDLRTTLAEIHDAMRSGASSA